MLLTDHTPASQVAGHAKRSDRMIRRYDVVLFDLLTGLLDSWTLWNRVAGSAEDGRRWRMAYPYLPPRRLTSAIV